MLDQKLQIKLTQSRVLTMSNNRKCNYLIVGCGRDSTIVMGIKDNNIIDIVFIKEILETHYKNLVSQVENICYEFGIDLVITDMNGFGLCFYEKFKESISSDCISIRGIKKLNSNSILNLKNDINNYKIRIMQSYNFAKNSYKKSFLGYSEVMSIHKESDRLIDEINNLDLDIGCNNQIRLKLKDKEIGKSRFNCLLIYYNYKYNKENIDIKQIDQDINKEKEIQRRMANYYICQGMFYKYLYKAIDNEDINIIFYHNGWNRILKFKNMIGEDVFKKSINNFIKYIKSAKDGLEIIFTNNSSIKFIYASDNARGYKYDYAVIDTEISRETFDNVILISDVYWHSKEQKQLNDNWNIEFMDFNS